MVQQIQQFKLYANVYKDLFSLVIETKVEWIVKFIKI